MSVDTICSNDQKFDFTVDSDSVMVTKFEDGPGGRDELGSMLFYEDQLDAVIEKLTAYREQFRSKAGG